MKKTILFIFSFICIFIFLVYRGMHILCFVSQDYDNYYEIYINPSPLIELPKTDFYLPDSLSENAFYYVITDSFIPLFSLYNRNAIITSCSFEISQNSLPHISFFVKEYNTEYFDEDISAYELIDSSDQVSLHYYDGDYCFYYLIITDSKIIKFCWINQPYAESYSTFSSEVYDWIMETYSILNT